MQAAQKDGRGWWTWGANLGNLIDAISDEKPVTRNLQPPIWMSVYFLSVSVQIWEASRKAVVFRSLVDCVERFINMCFFSASFGSFFQRDFFARPFVMARQVRAWWLVTRRWWIRWQRGARTCHIYYASRFKGDRRDNQWLCNVPEYAEPYNYCIYLLGSSSSIIHDDHRRCRNFP